MVITGKTHPEKDVTMSINDYAENFVIGMKSIYNDAPLTVEALDEALELTAYWEQEVLEYRGVLMSKKLVDGSQAEGVISLNARKELIIAQSDYDTAYASWSGAEMWSDYVQENLAPARLEVV